MRRHRFRVLIQNHDRLNTLLLLEQKLKIRKLEPKIVGLTIIKPWVRSQAGKISWWVGSYLTQPYPYLGHKVSLSVQSFL